ncbi:MAG: tetratricopeptide repeat protein [Immundisolibacter sp.]|uniref:tetratricopeptide repeat protein n=1 Tax=Immundisolibacter sp. TaxID=1934948 RepID=UPI003EE28064
MNLPALLAAVVVSAGALAWPRIADAALLGPETTPQEQPAASADNTDPAVQNYARGVEALRAGELDGAEKAFKAAAEANPRMPQPLVGLADVAQRRGDSPGAKKLLDQAVALAPNDDGAHYALAVFHVQTRDYLAAEAELKRVIEISPTLIRARLDLAGLYANSLSRPSDAIPAYRAAVQVDPTHAGAHQGLAMALAGTGQFKEAEAEYRKAAELAPDIPLPLHSLARMQLSRGQTDAGLASLDAALKVLPNFVPALLDKGDLLLGQGKTEPALTLFEQAVAADATSASAVFKRGAALQLLKRHTEAREAYEQTIALDANFAPAYNNLAWMQTESGGNLGQAEQWAATAVKLAPDSAAFRDTQGWVYRAQRKFSEAETVLEKAATMKPPLADVKYHLGLVYLDQRKTDQAKKAFREALAIDAKHAPSKQALQKMGDS